MDSFLSRIGFVIKVGEISQERITPIRKNVVNRFDEIGDLITLDRLEGESNTTFRDRQFDATVNRGGPDYFGLMNNLARELGCPKFHAVTIELTTGSNGIKIARNPRVDILADRIILYENWQRNVEPTIDRVIDFYDPNSVGYYLMNFVAEINESPYFIATIPAGVRPNLHTVNLIRGTSYKTNTSEFIFATEQHKFLFDNIIEDSIVFTEKEIFKTQVFSEPSAKGEFYIDYNNSYVVSYDLPSEEGSCDYAYNKFPMEVNASLIHIYSLQDEDFVRKLFVQEETNTGNVNALPNAEGSEIYHQLFKETSVFWGK
jgi:hypothetical protein